MAIGASFTGPSAGQMAALVEAQFRSQFHFLARGSKVGAVITGLMSLVWYGLVALGASGNLFIVGLSCQIETMGLKRPSARLCEGDRRI